MASGMVWAIVIIVIVIIIVIIILVMTGTFSSSSTTSGKKTKAAVTKPPTFAAKKPLLRTNNRRSNTSAKKTENRTPSKPVNVAQQRAAATRKVDVFSSTPKKTSNINQDEPVISKNINHYSELFDKQNNNEFGLTEEQMNKLTEEYITENANMERESSSPKNVFFNPSERQDAHDRMIDTMSSANASKRSEISVDDFIRDSVTRGEIAFGGNRKRGKVMNVSNVTKPKNGNNGKSGIIKKM